MTKIELALTNRILVLDGAMGTTLQSFNLAAHDFGGEALEGCNENLVLTRPDIIAKVHTQFFEAGCDIVETNTFGATPLVLGEYGLSDKAFEINQKAAEIAGEVAKKYNGFVAGSIGPTTKAISVTGGITFEELIDNFAVQTEGLMTGGVDYLLVETCQDTRNIKAATIGIEKAFQKLNRRIPIAISVTIEAMGTMLAGQGVEALLASVMHLDLLYIGLNCATGPEFMTDHIRSLAALSPFPVGCVPNAGLPDEHGCYLESPDMLKQVLARFIEQGWLNVIGGCCGTEPKHIKALVELAKGKAPRPLPQVKKSFLSGIDFLEITDSIRPVIVGERTNVIGSKKFKKLIAKEQFEEASEIARKQVKAGAQIIDVCLANPDRVEMEDMQRFLEQVVKKVKAPLMIDSTDEKVIEMALTYCQGKAIINSINLEDGEERFEKVLPLVKKFGAAVVVGTIDDDPEQGMGVTVERKLEIARREYQLLTQKYMIPGQDIYWDPLVFPCATGDVQYKGSAVATIEAIRKLKEEFPETKSVLGISNVSFGLPENGREVLNSVFLYHCVQSGLDLAIVNSEKLQRYASISDTERKLSDDLLYDRGEDPIAAFAAHFRQQEKVEKAPIADNLTLEERLAQYIIEGSKDGLTQDLEKAREKYSPLDIINGPLMKGMDEVGRLFNANQLIVAEVLQSAEAMKAAVGYLETFMEKAAAAKRGKVLLATVKGDVHDIGKNLVEIILSNNGFEVINLGIKIPPEQLISAIKAHSPDIVGLSGLLVKSAQQMAITAEDLSRAGTTPPMMVGGAALSERFVDRQIATQYKGTVVYASDAMDGLDLAKKIVDNASFVALQGELSTRRAQAPQENLKARPAEPESEFRPVNLSLATPPPIPDTVRHFLKDVPIDTLWKFINPLMLYGRHLGIHGDVVRKLGSHLKELEKSEPKAFEIVQAVERVKDQYRNSPQMKPQGVYQFFQCRAKGNQIQFANGAELKFPRQRKKDGLCLSDYLLPASAENPFPDHLALFLVTVGTGVREEAEKLKVAGNYLDSHILQVLALESAEAFAEYLHSRIRAMWGFPDSLEMTLVEKFQAKYRGKRYSFGYPACPRLDDQALLFELLKPQEIGVELTEGFMMEPEASVSALVFHHPQASYFSVGVES